MAPPSRVSSAPYLYGSAPSWASLTKPSCIGWPLIHTMPNITRPKFYNSSLWLWEDHIFFGPFYALLCLPTIHLWPILQGFQPSTSGIQGILNIKQNHKRDLFPISQVLIADTKGRAVDFVNTTEKSKNKDIDIWPEFQVTGGTRQGLPVQACGGWCHRDLHVCQTSWVSWQSIS